MKNMKTTLNLGNHGDDVIFDSQTCRVSILPAKGLFYSFPIHRSCGVKETTRLFREKTRFQDSLWKYLLPARVNCEDEVNSTIKGGDFTCLRSV